MPPGADHHTGAGRTPKPPTDPHRPEREPAMTEPHPFNVTVRTGPNSHTARTITAADEDAARAIATAALRPGQTVERVADANPFPGFTPELVDVHVEPSPGYGPTVRPVWSLPDGTTDSGFGFGTKDARMAARLEAAMRAGVVLSEPRVLVDVNGRQFVTARSHVLARMMNADLRRLGY